MLNAVPRLEIALLFEFLGNLLLVTAKAGSGSFLSHLYEVSQERSVNLLLSVVHFFGFQSIKIRPVRSTARLPICRATKREFPKKSIFNSLSLDPVYTFTFTDSQRSKPQGNIPITSKCWGFSEVLFQQANVANLPNWP